MRESTKQGCEPPGSEKDILAGQDKLNENDHEHGVKLRALLPPCGQRRNCRVFTLKTGQTREIRMTGNNAPENILLIRHVRQAEIYFLNTACMRIISFLDQEAFQVLW